MNKDLHDSIVKTFVDGGRLIEAGWVGFQLATIPNASQLQKDNTREAFFAGAQHLFASIVGMLDPGKEPTDKDLDRMTLIHVELQTFIKEMMDRLNQP